MKSIYESFRVKFLKSLVLSLLILGVFGSTAFAAPLATIPTNYEDYVYWQGNQTGKTYWITTSYTGYNYAMGVLWGPSGPYAGTVYAITGGTLGPSPTTGNMKFNPAGLNFNIYIRGIVIPAPTVSWQSSTLNSITFSWNAVTDAQGYRVYDSAGTLLGTTAGTSYTIPATCGEYKSIKVASYNYDYQSATSPLVQGRASTISAPTPSFSSATNSTVTWNWGAVANAQGYRVYNSAGTLLTTTAGTSYTMTGVSPGQVTSIKVGSYRDSFQIDSGLVAGQALPNTPTGLVYTTSRVSWSNNANVPGKGAVNLTWSAATGAAGYKVYMFDGYAWRMVQDVGNVLSWNSHNALIYPSDAVLDTYGANSQTGNLFKAVSTGEDLADRPTKLFSKTSGTTYDSVAYHYFYIKAYNSSGGETTNSNAVTPTLPDCTDTAAPTGSLLINDGAYNSVLKDVTLTISGSDSESGCYQISISNDNVSWSAWEAYTTSKAWQIPVGQGTKTVYLKIKDAAGNVSNLISSTIYLKDDVTGPTITIAINSGDTTTDSTSVTLTLTATDDNSTPDLLKQRFSNDGTTWSAWEATSFTKAWTLTAGADGARAVYYQVKDAVGNIQTAGDTITLSTAASEPDADAPTTPSSVGTVTINGVSYQVSNSSQVMLRVNSPTNVAKARYSFDGITFSPWETVVISTDAGGSYFSKDLTFTPGDGYRAVYLQFANSYGKESNVVVNRYVLDQTAPDFTVETTDGRTATSTTSVDLLITPKDNMSTAFEYSVNGGVNQALPASHIITVTGLTAGKLNTIKIRLFDGADNYTDKTFNIFCL